MESKPEFTPRPEKKKPTSRQERLAQEKEKNLAEIEKDEERIRALKEEIRELDRERERMGILSPQEKIMKGARIGTTIVGTIAGTAAPVILHDLTQKNTYNSNETSSPGMTKNTAGSSSLISTHEHYRKAFPHPASEAIDTDTLGSHPSNANGLTHEPINITKLPVAQPYPIPVLKNQDTISIREDIPPLPPLTADTEGKTYRTKDTFPEIKPSPLVELFSPDTTLVPGNLPAIPNTGDFLKPAHEPIQIENMPVVISENTYPIQLDSDLSLDITPSPIPDLPKVKKEISPLEKDSVSSMPIRGFRPMKIENPTIDISETNYDTLPLPPLTADTVSNTNRVSPIRVELPSDAVPPGKDEIYVHLPQNAFSDSNSIETENRDTTETAPEPAAPEQHPDTAKHSDHIQVDLGITPEEAKEFAFIAERSKDRKATENMTALPIFSAYPVTIPRTFPLQNIDTIPQGNFPKIHANPEEPANPEERTRFLADRAFSSLVERGLVAPENKEKFESLSHAGKLVYLERAAASANEKTKDFGNLLLIEKKAHKIYVIDSNNNFKALPSGNIVRSRDVGDQLSQDKKTSAPGYFELDIDHDPDFRRVYGPTIHIDVKNPQNDDFEFFIHGFLHTQTTKDPFQSSGCFRADPTDIAWLERYATPIEIRKLIDGKDTMIEAKAHLAITPEESTPGAERLISQKNVGKYYQNQVETVPEEEYENRLRSFILAQNR